MAQMIDFLSGSAQGLKHPKEATQTRQTQVTFSAPSHNCTATETYIGHPYSPAMYQPAALHEEGAERSQSVASPSCTVPRLVVTATVHFFPPSTPR